MSGDEDDVIVEAHQLAPIQEEEEQQESEQNYETENIEREIGWVSKIYKKYII